MSIELIKKCVDSRIELYNKYNIYSNDSLSFYDEEKFYYSKHEVVWMEECPYSEEIRGIHYKDDEVIIFSGYDDNFLIFMPENKVTCEDDFGNN